MDATAWCKHNDSNKPWEVMLNGEKLRVGKNDIRENKNPENEWKTVTGEKWSIKTLKHGDVIEYHSPLNPGKWYLSVWKTDNSTTYDADEKAYIEINHEDRKDGEDHTGEFIFLNNKVNDKSIRAPAPGSYNKDGTLRDRFDTQLEHTMGMFFHDKDVVPLQLVGNVEVG